ncbi:MAG: amidohydrolase family protein [Dehalococcoidales bacterium]|nr:amidohydrolase family protein [Dehalococcoidales bacterium]
MIIDFHTHVFSPRIKKNRARYIDADPSFALLYAKKEAKLATTDELIIRMDEDGVDMSVILNIGWTTHELCVETNDYILESIARYPDRLIGFASVQPQSTEAAIAEIERCAKSGIKGIGELRPDMQLIDPGDAAVMRPFVETMVKHKLILLTHSSEPIGHQYPGKGSVTPEILYYLIENYPELTVVCAHWGGGLPFYALMPEVKQAMGNVFFDTAASPYLYLPQIYHQVSQLVGSDRILFGSDYPLLAPSRLLNEIDSLGLPEETRGLILSGNARRLLDIKSKNE